MPRSPFALALVLVLSASPAFAQTPPAQSGSVIVVTVRVLTTTDPADQFDIREAAVRPGSAPRPSPFDLDVTDVQAGSPTLLVVDADGQVLHRQRFTWSRVLTIPPAPPGLPNDGAPNFVTIQQPEVSLVLPYFANAARIEVVPAAGGRVTARALERPDPSPSLAAAIGIASPAPSTPGALNVLLIASGFTPARIPLFPAIASAIQAQMMSAEPFATAGSSVVFRAVQATTNLGCSPGCAGIERLMCCTSSAVINTAVASGLPFDEIVVVHDTSTYAGSGGRDVGNYRTNSYSTYATAYNGVWTEEMVKHEFGHSFGNLCDEYTYGSEPYVYNACPNCRPACSDLLPYGACLASCDAAPSFFRPDPSIMLDLTIPTFNNASIATPAPVDGLATRLSYFLGSTPPPAPTGLQATTTASSATLSWNASPGAASYRLVLGTAPGASNIFNGSIGNLTSISGPVPPGTYYWRLFAINFAGSSPSSAEAQFTVGTPETPPSSPTNLQASVNGNNVTLSWNASALVSRPLSGATSYTLQVGTATGASNLFNAPVGNLTSVSGVVGNGSYFWRVIATNSAGSSPPSAESQFTVGCTAPPGAPGAFTFLVTGNTVALNWTAPATGGTPSQYVIEAGSASGLSNLATLPTGSTALGLTTAAPPGTFYVRVRAQNACGLSVPSNEQVIVVP